MYAAGTHIGWCALALAFAFVSPPTSNAFLAPSLPGRAIACRHHNQKGDRVSTIGMNAEKPPSCSTTPSSRRAFIERGVMAAAAAGLVAASTAAPAPSIAKDFGGIDVKGIDVSEVLHPGAGVGGGKATKPLRDCVLNVERVRVSTKQLEDELTNNGAPPGLNGLVKGLIKNYRLEESLQQGALYIESQGDRNAAASAGREAIEYLAQTAEYFPPEIDERTGKVKSLNAEALEFTVNALGATRGKLDLFLSKVPSDALREARAEMKAEGGGDQS